MTTPAPAPNQVPGSFSIPAAAPVYVDGISTTAGSAAIQAPPFNALPSQRFWSSQRRSIGDPHDELLVITMPSAQMVNYLAFDLAHFPHQARFFWLPPGVPVPGSAVPQSDASKWKPVLTKRGVPLVITVSGSVPAMVNSPAALKADVNPYHYGAGHWMHHDEDITPFLGATLIIALTRRLSGPGGYPVDPSGHPSVYPLGVRSLDIGYRATSKDDLPSTLRSPSTVTERLPFAVVTDLLGSPVQLAVRENRASDLLQGKSWQSAPQPYPYSVVLLYADCRDSAGNPQVIDGLIIDPLTSGVSMNVYYSGSPPPPGEFRAVDTPLSFPVTQAYGASVPSVGTDGILFPDAAGWLSIDNAAVQWNPAQPWWAAFEIMPQFSSSDPHTYAVADWGAFQLIWNGTAGAWQMTSAGGTTAAQPFAHAVNDRIWLAVGYDGQNVGFCTSGGGTSVIPSSAPGATGQLLLGGVANQSAPGNMRLRSLVLKQEQISFAQGDSGATLPPQVIQFIADSFAYVTPSLIPRDDTGTTRNSLMRFAPAFCLGSPLNINPYGFVGGPGDLYANATWTPVCRDGKVAKGTFRFDPVLASCIKLEFTNLLARTYNYYAASVKTVRTMPDPSSGNTHLPVVTPVVTSPSASGMTSAQAQAATTSPAAPVPDTGLAVNQSAAPTVSWPDSQPLTPPAPATGGLPTEGLTAPTPAADQALSAFGPLYQMQSWQQAPGASGFSATGTHSYQEQQVVQRSRTAYFAGLSSLLLSRVDYTTQHDPDRYTDLFLDTAFIDPATMEYTGPDPQPWSWQPGELSVPYGLSGFAQVSSLPFPSTRNVTAIQFAAQQSDPVQLLPDPDFSDPALRSWAPVGDAAPLQLSDSYTSAIGELAQVTRIPSQYSWELLEQAYPSWAAIMATGFSWQQLEGAAQSLGYGGITSVGGVRTTDAGRVYAAARVFAPADLTFPLYLQIVDADTGAILAQEPQQVQAGVPAEWFVGATLAPGATSAMTWSQVESTYPIWADITGLLWQDINQVAQPAGSSLVVQLVQYGISDDTWDVDTLSIFEDSIVWEFSNDGGNSWWPAYDIRNNPQGVLVLPPPSGPALSAGTRLMWRLSGYRPGLVVNSLAIRPWYGSLPGGVRAGIPVAGGPNLNIQDHYPPIADDPRWKAWSSPIPQDWWFAFRQQLSLEVTQAAPPAEAPVPQVYAAIGQIVVIAPAQPGGGGSQPDGPVTWSDLYANVYQGIYGTPDGGDIYTDNFGNNTYPLADDPN